MNLPHCYRNYILKLSILVKSRLLIICLSFAIVFDVSAQSARSIAGVYQTGWGTFTIAVNDGNILTGYYDYLDQFDPKLHTFLTQMSFSIYGHSTDGKTYYISVTPDEEPKESFKGKMVFSNSGLEITLPESANVSARFDITGKDHNNVFPLVDAKPYLAIMDVKGDPRIKTNKAMLFDYDGQHFVAKKAFLLPGDVVYVVRSINNYVQIIYKNWNAGTIRQYWISKDSIEPIQAEENQIK